MISVEECRAFVEPVFGPEIIIEPFFWAGFKPKRISGIDLLFPAVLDVYYLIDSSQLVNYGLHYIMHGESNNRYSGKMRICQSFYGDETEGRFMQFFGYKITRNKKHPKFGKNEL